MSAISSISKNHQPTFRFKPNLGSKTYQPIRKPIEFTQIDWIAFRLTYDIDWRWYQQDNIRFCGHYCQFKEGERVKYEMSLLLTEVKNDIEWKQYKQAPNAVIESKYLFRCLYSDNNKFQESIHLIHHKELESNYLDDLILDYRRCGQDAIEKFELGIQVVFEKDYEGNFLNNYMAKLMVKRCKQIWHPITREQISRGLVLTEMGQQYLDAQLADLQEGTTPQLGQLLPQKGIEAAKKRAHQWKGSPLP